MEEAEQPDEPQKEVPAEHGMPASPQFVTVEDPWGSLVKGMITANFGFLPQGLGNLEAMTDPEFTFTARQRKQFTGNLWSVFRGLPKDLMGAAIIQVMRISSSEVTGWIWYQDLWTEVFTGIIKRCAEIRYGPATTDAGMQVYNDWRASSQESGGGKESAPPGVTLASKAPGSAAEAEVLTAPSVVRTAAAVVHAAASSETPGSAAEAEALAARSAVKSIAAVAQAAAKTPGSPGTKAKSPTALVPRSRPSRGRSSGFEVPVTRSQTAATRYPSGQPAPRYPPPKGSASQPFAPSVAKRSTSSQQSAAGKSPAPTLGKRAKSSASPAPGGWAPAATPGTSSLRPPLPSRSAQPIVPATRAPAERPARGDDRSRTPAPTKHGDTAAKAPPWPPPKPPGSASRPAGHIPPWRKPKPWSGPPSK